MNLQINQPNRTCALTDFVSSYAAIWWRSAYNENLLAEKEVHVEMLEIVLSIVASVLSIAATVVAFKNKKEVERLRDLYEGNKLTANGNGNAQVMGTGNQVNTNAR